jgi:hypothetical protein
MAALDVTKPIMMGSPGSQAASVARTCHMERRGFAKPVLEAEDS